MALFYQCLFAIGLVNATALQQLALVGAQSHGTTHLGDVLLLLHHIDNIVRRLLVHLAAVGILIAQDVACKLYHHHLHT